MAKDSNNTHCPVAPLADEAQRLIAAHNAVDQKAIGAAEADKPRYHETMELTVGALDAVVERASWLEAKSAKGALFQVCALVDMLNLFDAESSHEKAAQRLLHSLASYIESTSPDNASLEDYGDGWFLDRRHSAHAYLAEAFRLAEARGEEAA